jgi:cbb3-type cytochrome oxidase subunit 3
MDTFIDIAMTTLFILFMVFVFGGYHKNKSTVREAQREADEKRSKNKENKI